MVDCREAWVLRSAFGLEPHFNEVSQRWEIRHGKCFASCYATSWQYFPSYLSVSVSYGTDTRTSFPLLDLDWLLQLLKSYIKRAEKCAITPNLDVA